MPEVSYLRLAETVEDAEQEDVFTFDSPFPLCSLVFSSESDPITLDVHHIHHAAAFDPEFYDRFGASGSGSFEGILDSETQVTFVMDLFQQRVEQSNVLEIGSFEPVPILEYDFGLIDRNIEEIGRNSLELDAGELLGSGTVLLDSGGDQDDNFGGFIVSDCGDEFLVSRSETANNSGGSSTSERNRSSGGSNLVDFGSDSEDDGSDLLIAEVQSEDDNASHGGNDDMNITFFWDSLQLEDHRDGIDEFEWEEVDGAMDVLNPEESISVLPIAGPEEDEIEERNDQLGSRNLEWEVLLNVNNLGRNLDAGNNEGPYFGGHDDYLYPAEYEMTIGLAGGENPSIGRPPASKMVVESLPCVTVTEEDVLNGDALCVVCKDDMGVGEWAKQLSCSHRYHGDCIILWLKISNTCPVCRHELPTDDPDYEQRRAQRAARA